MVGEGVRGGVGGIAFEDPEVLLEHLRQRPVGDALAVGEAASGPAQRFGELPRATPRALARAVSCRHRHRRGSSPDAARLSATTPLYASCNCSQLVLAPDEDAGAGRALRAGASARSRAPAAGRRHRPACPWPRSSSAPRTRRRHAPRRTVRSPTRISPGGRGLLEPRAHVDRVAGRRTSCPRAAGRRPPRRCSTPIRSASRPPNSLAEPPLHRKRRVQRPLGVVLVRRRGAEGGHHRVAGELLDRAAGRSISTAIVS